MSRSRKFSASIIIGSALEASVKKDVGFLRSGLSKVGVEIKKVEQRQRELAKHRRVLEKEGRSVAALDREYEALERQLKDLRRAQERWNRAAASSRRVGAAYRDMAMNIRNAVRTITIGAGLAGGAVFGLTKSTADLGDNVAKTAARLGMQIDALQELRYASERSGMSVGQFDKAIEMMNRGIGEAIAGTGTAKDALKGLGLDAQKLAKMEPDAALSAIARALEGVDDHATRAALAADLFGRSGASMLNLLKDGPEGLDALREAARKTGYVLSEQAARDAEAFADALLDTRLSLTGLKNTVGVELLPVVTDAMKSITSFLVENRTEVKAWSKSFAEGVGKALPVVGDIARGLVRVASITGAVTSRVAGMVGGWENLAVIVGAAVSAKLVLSVVRFGVAVGQLGFAMVSLTGSLPLVAAGIKAVGLALVANPVGAVIAGIALGGYLIWNNWDKLGPMFEASVGKVMESLGGLLEFVEGVFTLDWKKAGSGLARSWKGWTGLVGIYTGGVGKVVTKVWTTSIGPFLRNVGDVAGIGSAWQALWESIGEVLEWLAAKFEAVWRRIQPVIDGLRWVKDKASSILPGGTQPGPSAPATVRPKGPATPRSKPGGPRVRQFAMGGMAPAGFNLVGELGPELRFDTRAGYVATNRAFQRLSGMAAKIGRASDARRMVSALPAAARSVAGGFAKQAASAGNVFNYTVQASGLSAAELVAELDRRARRDASSELFDTAGLGFEGG